MSKQNKIYTEIKLIQLKRLYLFPSERQQRPVHPAQTVTWFGCQACNLSLIVTKMNINHAKHKKRNEKETMIGYKRCTIDKFCAYISYTNIFLLM